NAAVIVLTLAQPDSYAEQPVQRRLSRFRRRHYQPRYLSSHDLRRLLLVAPEHELIPAVLLPGLGLKPDGRRVLAGLHDRIPLRAGRKRVGHDAFYDLPQGHISSPPGYVSPTPISPSSPRILMASAMPTAHSKRRTSSLASSGAMIFSAGPSADTRTRTWPLRVGCTTILMSYTLLNAPSWAS